MIDRQSRVFFCVNFCFLVDGKEVNFLERIFFWFCVEYIFLLFVVLVLCRVRVFISV